jgi:S1-C subfamily serine protease
MKIILIVMAVILAATAAGSGYYISSLNGQINGLEDELALNYAGLDQSLKDTAERLDTADAGLEEALVSSNTTLNDAIATVGGTLSEYKDTTDSQFQQVSGDIALNKSEITSLTGRVDKAEGTINSSALNSPQLYEKVHQAMVTISDGTNLMGSGFITDFVYEDNNLKLHDQLVVTAYHVVGGMSEIYITLDDGTTWLGNFLAGSEEADIALLRIMNTDAGHQLDYYYINNISVDLANSGTVKAGDPVFVVGCPYDYEDYRLGLEETINTGVISQVNRGGTVGDKYMADLLQFDAAANFGNSGSPLFNTKGEVIGVVIGRINPLLGDGISVAVASNLIQKVEECIDRSVTNWGKPLGMPGFEYKYPWTGITVVDIVPEVMWDSKNTITPGAQVTSVTGPGTDAGIKAGDIITGIDSLAVHDTDEFYSFLAEYDVGDSVVLTVERGGEILEITVVLEEKP